ncbi:MAG TPA: helix-turn-helix transcriptional regulator [Mycobacteriales bacterium]|nr:helix-turn-helix transcriptional regulator [Mycobacteriales bacterium]
MATGRSSTFTDARGLIAALAAINGSDPTSRHHHDSDRATDLDALVDRDVTDRRTFTVVDPLTRSQLRVCRLAALGKSNSDIADELFVSRATVESHLHASYRKLGIASRFALPIALRRVA